VKPVTVACADSSQNTLLYTVDGLMWYGCGVSALNIANAVEWNGSYWLAVGSSSNTWFAISRDGTSWLKQYDSTLDEGSSVAWNGTTWLAGGLKGGTASLVKSTNGTTWSTVTISLNGVPYVMWNGYKWLVSAGSAVYSSVDLLTWTQEAIASGNINQISVQSFTESSNSPATNAFDASLGSAWSSSSGAYDASGNGGEWLQVDLGSSVQVNHYTLKSNASGFYLQGSPDTVTWTSLDTQTLDVSTNNILLTFVNNNAYRYYKVVFTKIADSSTVLQVYNLAFYSSSGTSKPLIVHKSWTASFPSGYVQYLNIPSAYLNGRALQTVGPVSTSYSYNGQYSLLTDASNAYYSSVDFSFVQVSATMNTIKASTYNGTYFMVGGSSVKYAHPSDMSTWYNTLNIDSLLGGGTIVMLKSNTGQGFAASPNALHLNPGEKLSVVAPKFYDLNMEKRGASFVFSLT
jgi:hypothetical protein